MSDMYKTPSPAFRYKEESISIQGDGFPDLLQEWQERLRVSDWEVTVEFLKCRNHQSGSVGSCLTTPCLRSAHITILERGEIADSDLFPIDQERVLVHELLHLHFDPFMVKEDEDRVVNTAQEIAIDMMARALVHARRYGEKGNITDVQDSRKKGR